MKKTHLKKALFVNLNFCNEKQQQQHELDWNA